MCNEGKVKQQPWGFNNADGSKPFRTVFVGRKIHSNQVRKGVKTKPFAAETYQGINDFNIFQSSNAKGLDIHVHSDCSNDDCLQELEGQLMEPS